MKNQNLTDDQIIELHMKKMYTEPSKPSENLISAAPEMLEALESVDQTILNLIDPESIIDTDQLNRLYHAIHLVESAIKKAKGL